MAKAAANEQRKLSKAQFKTELLKTRLEETAFRNYYNYQLIK